MTGDNCTVLCKPLRLTALVDEIRITLDKARGRIANRRLLKVE